MTTSALRQQFLNFFKQRNHTVVASGPLVPAQDKTIMFNNAGMVPFKDVFLGQETRSYTQATSSQKCLRAGGKHNDLENVGYTDRHLTFFEMLGNFSFGSYFKEQAIVYAWDFLTKELALPASKLVFTVHHSDQESEELWKKIAGAGATVLKLDEDNFWSMGKLGPCGPCTEIFYDRGERFTGGLPGSIDEGDRWIEIWNLVFMQYDRLEDGSTQPLPMPCVDTGMGLERTASIMQGVDSNFDIDIMAQLQNQAKALIGKNISEKEQVHLRIVADHIRSVVFLLGEGIVPSNEGPGYVLRRIFRRAIRHFMDVGGKAGHFAQMAEKLQEVMGDSYPETFTQTSFIYENIQVEEERFLGTLERGLKVFRKQLGLTQGKVFSGESAFLLYDTYGFPVDMTADLLREHDKSLDMKGFEQSMDEQRNRAKSASNFQSGQLSNVNELAATKFLGYQATQSQATVLALWNEQRQSVQSLQGIGYAVFNQTPFYRESGGQIADTGMISSGDAPDLQAIVTDCQAQGELYVHQIEVTCGNLQIAEDISLQINTSNRQEIAKHHSATHLLHAALSTHVGENAQQQGSWVGPNGFRFDINHGSKIEPEILRNIEKDINEVVQQDAEVTTQVLPFDQAIAAGAKAFFDDKYGDEVRVLNMANGYSVELCGGTHVNRTGEIGPVLITGEASIASGVRRIQGVAGQQAQNLLLNGYKLQQNLSASLGVPSVEIEPRIDQLQTKLKELEKQVGSLKNELAVQGAKRIDLDLSGKKAQLLWLPTNDGKVINTLASMPKGYDLLFVIGAGESNTSLIVTAAKGLEPVMHANQWLTFLAGEFSGKGGGKPVQARGGCPSHLPLEKVKATILARDIS